VPTPFQTETYYDCTTCKLRPFRHFCNLQMDQVEALQLVKKTLVFPPDAVVFNEGDVPEGVFILCSGRVKLFSATQHGKIFILKIARPGELLGLNATIMDRPYLVSAETVEPCQINFVPRDAFLQYIAEFNEASTHVIEQLADNYYAAQREIQSLGLAQSARQKLARLLVDWSHATEQTKGEIWPNANHRRRPRFTKRSGVFSSAFVISIADSPALARERVHSLRARVPAAVSSVRFTGR